MLSLQDEDDNQNDDDDDDDNDEDDNEDEEEDEDVSPDGQGCPPVVHELSWTSWREPCGHDYEYLYRPINYLHLGIK